MLSRVANAVYWMFRYLERAQNIARFLDTDLSQFLDDPQGQGSLWRSLIAATGDSEEFEKRYSSYGRTEVLNFLTVDTEYPNSVISCLQASRENARSIREIISSEMWEDLNSLYLRVRDYQKLAPELRDSWAFCKDILSGCYLFLGLFYATMNRGEAWHFARLGMLLERADKTSRILDVKYFLLLPQPTMVGSSYDNMQWAALLKSVSGLEMYRKTYRRIDPRHVVEFLLFDKLFPRSVRHCFQYAEDSIRAVRSSSGDKGMSTAERSLLRLRSELETGTIQEVLDFGLHEYLDQLQTRMNQTDQDVFDVFFSLKLDPEKKAYHGNLDQNQS